MRNDSANYPDTKAFRVWYFGLPAVFEKLPEKQCYSGTIATHQCIRVSYVFEIFFINVFLYSDYGQCNACYG